MSDITDEMKRELQKNAGIPNMPTDLTYECRMAVSGEGPRAYDWSDKPHRLVFDLSRCVEALEVELSALRAALAGERKRGLAMAAMIAETPSEFMKFDGDFEGNQIAAAVRALMEKPE